jgi:5-(carboxyamino)imidazole ribonucleotide synthase
MTGALPPNATIGIVGGGQLGRMSALAAARLGYRCHILTPEEDSPAAQVAAGVTVGDYEDERTLRAFAGAVDVITFEFENVSARGLDLLASLKPVRPSPAVLRVSQDRIAEKSFLNGIGVRTAPWLPVATPGELEAALSRLGRPAILKTTRGGYDGKGQVRIDAADDASAAFEALRPDPLILEGHVDFALEISVVAARGLHGGTVAFDAVENRHRNHILDLTLAPAPIPEAVSEAALWPAILEAPGLIPHLYGKAEAREGRKMGHVTRLFPRGGLPGPFGIDAALGPALSRSSGP